jgi:hypothetical protein
VEARAGIEPADRGFAVHGITTLLPGQKREYRRFLAKKRKKSKLLIKKTFLYSILKTKPSLYLLED